MLGPNGAGKTTLLRMLATLLRPHAGELRVLGHALPDEGWAVRGRIGLLGHEPLLYRELTARENLRLPRRAARRRRRARSASCSRAVGMERRADEPVRTLSRGMVQRVAVCRALLHDPELLLLDEPRANLDPAASELVEPLIGRASGRTRVIVSHDPAGALAEADLVLGLVRGRAALLRAGRRARRATRPRSSTGERRRAGARAVVGAAAQGAARRAAHVRVGAGDDAVQRHDLRALPLRPAARTRVTGNARERRAVGDAAVRRRCSASTACSSPTPSRAASTASCSRRSTAARCCVAKALTLLDLPGRASRSSPCRRSRCCCSGPRSGRRCPGCSRVLALGDLGVAAIGTLVGALAVRTRARDLLGPLLSLPLLVPVVIGAALRDHAALLDARRRRCRCAGW